MIVSEIKDVEILHTAITVRTTVMITIYKFQLGVLRPFSKQCFAPHFEIATLLIDPTFNQLQPLSRQNSVYNNLTIIIRM